MDGEGRESLEIERGGRWERGGDGREGEMGERGRWERGGGGRDGDLRERGCCVS